MSGAKLTHLNDAGEAHMVDVGDKDVSKREATARATLRMSTQAFSAIREGNVPKGDVGATARIAGIMAAKQTHVLIPLCHPLPISHVSVRLEFESDDTVHVLATVRTTGRTGVEMEALTAASVSALTVYDMCKAIDKAMVIGPVMLLEKSGGQSGDFTHPALENG